MDAQSIHNNLIVQYFLLAGLPGSFGDSFIVLVEEAEERLIWDNLCFMDHIVEHQMMTSSVGIHALFYMNTVKLTKDENQTMGSVVLSFSEAVTLSNLNYPKFGIVNTGFIPTNHIGTEYMIVLPPVKATDYFARICSIYNDTGVLAEISDVNNPVLKNKQRVQIDMHEVFSFHRKFDFSGSRILSSRNVALFSFMSSHFESSPPVQLIATKFYGSTYQIPYDCFQDGDGEINSTIRLTAIFPLTSVNLVRDDIMLVARGETLDLRRNLRLGGTLTSRKRYIVVVSRYATRPFHYFLAPNVQYIQKEVTMFHTSFPQFSMCYTVPLNGIIDFSANASRFMPWKAFPLKFENWVTYNDSGALTGIFEIDYLLMGHSMHVYITSASPFGGFYRNTLEFSTAVAWKFGDFNKVNRESFVLSICTCVPNSFIVIGYYTAGHKNRSITVNSRQYLTTTLYC